MPETPLAQWMRTLGLAQPTDPVAPAPNMQGLAHLQDPTRASVLDSESEQLARAIAAAMQNGELAGSAMAASPAVAKVPREATEALMGRLLRNWKGWAEVNQTEVPSTIEEALRYLVEKFPRTASHIHGVERMAADTPKKIGQFWPDSMSQGRVGSVFVKEDLGFLDALETLAHEMTHGGQALRSESRGEPFMEAYARARNIWGYPKNPYEVRAREAMLNQRYRFTNPKAGNKLNREFAAIDAGARE